ncbi:Indoleamine 2,3-dioxygenase [Phycomyces nitens]|nr:Indoleamine 2,3-dioxygenase [Phycomyces nitens]
MQSLESYDISPQTGFLPSTPPLRRLPSSYFAPWESLMEDCNALLLAGKLRERVHKLPLLDSSRLQSVEEYRRAFLILCMVSHSYVWGKHEKTLEILPACLAVPWTTIADHLGLCPVVCHAAVVLWNYRLLDNKGPLNLSNLAALETYTGSLDESWFYLVTTEIESVGAPCLQAITKSIDHIKDGDYSALIEDLQTVNSALEGMNTALQRMYEKCDPYVFYWKIRPYLAGWENMAEVGLPFGLIYEGLDSYWNAETDEYADMSHLSEAERLLHQYRRYAGGSAAQSSLIATLDVAFGVEHHPTGQKPPVKLDPSTLLNRDRYTHPQSTKPADELNHPNGSATPQTPPTFVRTNRNRFLRAMRKYMPLPHRNFLEDLEVAANLRPFMLQLQEKQLSVPLTEKEKQLLGLYNGCLNQLKLFRDKHVQIVTLYIVNQSRKGVKTGGGCPSYKKEALEAKSISTKTIPAKEEGSETATALYPQSALDAERGIREGSVSAKVNQLFPQLGLAKHVDPKTGVVRGTGGTNIMPFLKQSRDETNDMKLPIADPKDVPEAAVAGKSFTDWILRR